MVVLDYYPSVGYSFHNTPSVIIIVLIIFRYMKVAYLRSRLYIGVALSGPYFYKVRMSGAVG
ncbi:hypothetical protein GE21DRAFT_1221425 [Neurospora crassa]|nr:hypothetical protein GE21DRAFT_1221425 [Neurospora crassa]